MNTATVTDELKQCTRCKTTKPVEEFTKRAGRPGSWCLVCHCAANSGYSRPPRCDECNAHVHDLSDLLFPVTVMRSADG